MALYLISYDIGDKDKFEYGPLWDKLRELSAVRILYSEWLVERPIGEAALLYGEISALTLTSDRLLVHEVTKDASWDKLLISDTHFSALLKKARG